jgi:hypothetical protein
LADILIGGFNSVQRLTLAYLYFSALGSVPGGPSVARNANPRAVPINQEIYALFSCRALKSIHVCTKNIYILSTVLIKQFFPAPVAVNII